MFQTQKKRLLLSLLLFSMFPKIMRRHVLPLRPICRGSSCETKRPLETASDPPVVYVGQTASDHFLGHCQNDHRIISTKADSGKSSPVVAPLNCKSFW